MPTPPAWDPVVTCFASSLTLKPLARRRRSRSISVPAELGQHRDARSGFRGASLAPCAEFLASKRPFELNCHDLGNRPEFRQIVELDRPCQHADVRQGRSVLEAERTTRGGDLVNAPACVLRDRDRNVDPAHRSPRVVAWNGACHLTKVYWGACTSPAPTSRAGATNATNDWRRRAWRTAPRAVGFASARSAAIPAA